MAKGSNYSSLVSCSSSGCSKGSRRTMNECCSPGIIYENIPILALAAAHVALICREDELERTHRSACLPGV